MSYLPVLYSPHCPLPGEEVSLCLRGQEAIDIATKCFISVTPFALSFISPADVTTLSMVCPLVKILSIEEQEQDQSLRIKVLALEFVRIATVLKTHSKYLYPVVKVINTVSLGELGVNKLQPAFANWIEQFNSVKVPAAEVVDISPIIEHLEISANDRWLLINEQDPQRFETLLRWHLVLSTEVQKQIKYLGTTISNN